MAVSEDYAMCLNFLPVPIYFECPHQVTLLEVERGKVKLGRDHNIDRINHFGSMIGTPEKYGQRVLPISSDLQQQKHHGTAQPATGELVNRIHHH